MRTQDACDPRKAAACREGAVPGMGGMVITKCPGSNPVAPLDGVGASLGGRVELRCACGATCGLDWDFGAAIGTFGGVGGFLLGFSFDAVDGFDEHEYGESNDEEL